MTESMRVRGLRRAGAVLTAALALTVCAVASGCGRRARPDGTTSTQQASGAEAPGSTTENNGGATPTTRGY